MHGSWLEVSADLDAGYKFNSRLFGGAAALGQTIQGVVISNGDRAGSCPGGEADQFGRSHATIREFGMRVEVDQVCRHSSILSASCRSSQFRATCRSRNSRRKLLAQRRRADHDVSEADHGSKLGDRPNLALEAIFEVDISQMAPRANYGLHLVLNFRASPTALRRRGR